MQLWVWRNIRIELPEDWEMLQFSRNPQAGRCAWADRYQFRAELSWQAVSGPPDAERLASDYVAKLRLDGTMPDAAAARSGEWHGLRGHEGGQYTSRFSRYLAEEGCLIELVLLWPDELPRHCHSEPVEEPFKGGQRRHEGRSVAGPSSPERCFDKLSMTAGEHGPRGAAAHDGMCGLEAGILASVGVEAIWPRGMRRWRAFGLDVLASGGLDLVECSVQPALARLAFGDRRGTRHETFERLGMVPHWLHGSVREWLLGRLPRDVRPTTDGRTDTNEHQVESVGGVRRGGLFRRPSRYEAAAWLCPADGRLYCVTIEGGAAAEGPAPPRERLVCCGRMRMNG